MNRGFALRPLHGAGFAWLHRSFPRRLGHNRATGVGSSGLVIHVHGRGGEERGQLLSAPAGCIRVAPGADSEPCAASNCAEDRCPNVAVKRGRCAEHQLPRAGGSTRRWRKARAKALRRDRYRCVICGAKATLADHIVARADGGTDTERNLRPLLAHESQNHPPRAQ